MDLNDLVKVLSEYEVVVSPDESIPEWWAGAPSVTLGPDGKFYLACRMREGESPKGRRGYEIRIFQSSDGIRFEKVHGITREDAGVPGFERPSLVFDAEAGVYRLYCCTSLGRGWGIIRFEDQKHPTEFKPASWRTVLEANPTDEDTIQITGYKDPFVFRYRGEWNMLVIGIDRVERAYRFTSQDGEIWFSRPETPILENRGWHQLYTRPACVLPLSTGFLFIYEGSHVRWFDPNYNIATGLAYTTDLETFVDLTPEAPLLVSTTPGRVQTWRYSHWLRVGHEVYVYFEAANSDGTNELRMAKFPADDFLCG